MLQDLAGRGTDHNPHIIHTNTMQGTLDDSFNLKFSHRSQQKPLHTPAALRPEGSTVRRSNYASRDASSSASTAQPSPTSSVWLQQPRRPVKGPPRDGQIEPSSLEDATSTPSTASDASLRQSAPSAMLSREQWVPDSEVEQCQYSDCTAMFHKVSPRNFDGQSATHFFGGFTTIIVHPFQARRHHCRSCGRIFCSQHSSNSLPLTQPSGMDDSLLSPPPPTTPGTTSPISEAFPFSVLRRGSSSGTSTPAASHENSSLPPSETSPIQHPHTVQCRVCDDCFVSLQVTQSLAMLGVQGPSASTSPSSSHNLSDVMTPSARSAGSTSNTQAEPSLTSRLDNANRKAVLTHAESATKGLMGGDPVNKTVSSHAYISKTPLAAPHEIRKKSALPVHPLDPRHVRLAQAAAQEDSGGSNPDGSIPASLGTTPAVGWTWSTF